MLKHIMITVVVLLTLAVLPATAVEKGLSAEASAGLLGVFGGGGTYLPLEAGMTIGFTDVPMFTRVDAGYVVGLGPAGDFISYGFGFAYNIVPGGYVVVDVGGWMPMDPALDPIEDSTFFLKPGAGYEYRGFFGEVSVPLMFSGESFAMSVGWQLKVGYRLPFPH
jgi:hypothetical protein